MTQHSDEICIGYEDDVPVFVKRDSAEGKRQIELEQRQAENPDWVWCARHPKEAAEKIRALKQEVAELAK